MNPNTRSLPPFFAYTAIFSIAFATLALELLQTRVLSTLYVNHVVYLTVTVALMGFGISGVFVSIFQRRLTNPAALATACLGAFAVLTPLCLRLASFSPVLFPKAEVLAKLLFCYAVLTLPFICAGIALAVLLMSNGANIHRLYFVDLAASALGVLFFALLLRPLGAEQLAWCIVLVVLAGYVISGRACGFSILWLLAPFILVGATYVGCSNPLFNDFPEFNKVGGNGDPVATPGFNVERSEWTTIARIDVLTSPMFVGADPDNDEGTLHYKLVCQDRDAPTSIPSPEMVRYRLRMAEPGRPLYGPGLGYIVRPRPQDVLILGTGGGIDVVDAQAFGSQRITGVEINPATVDMMQGVYAETAAWPRWPNVRLVCGEGRHFVATTPERYDVMVMSGVDTFAALSTGAYVLSENYLYTVEAMEDYLRCLKPDGVMVIFRWLFQQPRESLRLVNLYLAAAERQQIAEPWKNLMVVAVDWGWQYRWAAVLVKKEPFTPAEVQAVLRRIEGQRNHPPSTLGPMAVVYLPEVLPVDEQRATEQAAFQHDTEYLAQARQAFGGLIRCRTASDRRAFADAYFYNITPVYDDRPFFFEYHKLSNPFTSSDGVEFLLRGTVVHYTLFILLAFTGLVAWAAMIVPLTIFEREGIRLPRVRSLIGFFACLGVGFMFLELGTVQILNLYLGHPMYSLAVVLAGLLFFTGLGSFCSAKVGPDTRSVLRRGLFGTALAALAWMVAVAYVVPLTRSWSIGARVALTLLSLMPLGLFMGIPFATGLRYLSAHHPRFIPWAWGINGLTSVMGSVLAIILAMRIGFQAVMLLGILTYVLGYVMVAWHLRVPWEPSAEPAPPATDTAPTGTSPTT